MLQGALSVDLGIEECYKDLFMKYGIDLRGNLLHLHLNSLTLVEKKTSP